MIGKNVREALIDQTQGVSRQTRATISLESKPLEPGQFPYNNHLYKRTNLTYNIRYSPERDPKRPFLIVTDLAAGGKIRISDREDLVKYSERPCLRKNDNSLVAKWIYENTDITDELLAFIKKSPERTFPLNVNIFKYNKRLKSQPGYREQIFEEVLE